MGNQYLLEVGTEELPAGFLETAPGELRDKVAQLLQEEGVTCEGVNVLSTPRRLALLLNNVSDKVADKQLEHKGPPTKIALDAQGNPTPAGLGFAKKLGVDFGQLKKITVEGEEYLGLSQTIAGGDTQSLLKNKLPEVVLSLSGSHFMHWGYSAIKFSRPIRWLVSLWNNTHLPMTFDTLKSGTVSTGHRILGEAEIGIPAVDQYESLLASQGKVLVNPESRKTQIWEALQKKAKSLGGVVQENEELLETVTRLVETPHVIAGQFDPKYLAIPQEVIVTVMAAHQKYFPVHQNNAADSELLPYFLTVSNGRPEAEANIAKGNERVLVARLEDARFFFEEDQKMPLKQRTDALKGVMFQKGLGSMFDKTARLQAISKHIAEALTLSESQQKDAFQAASLAKCDLLTGMVRELTELQGVMGKKYALLQGESPSVSEALFEQYLPRFTGDSLPKNPVGITLSLADKLDTLVAVFAQKGARLPSGSKDPMALRRMTYGIIRTVLENGLRLNLSQMIQTNYLELGSLATADKTTALDLLNSFMLQRLKGYFLDHQYRYDVIDAVLEAKDPFADLMDVQDRLAAVRALTQNEAALKAIYEPANRIGKILGTNANLTIKPEAVQASLFKDSSEEALFAALKTIPTVASTETKDYTVLIQALAAVQPQIEAFFEKVLINDPDEAVKQNRYALLNLFHAYYLNIAQFGLLMV
jgi:glycyl-tRNA synthetase beta chain